MLAYLRGTIKSKEMTGGASDRLVIEVADIGFELHVSHQTLLKIGQIDDSVTVYTALSIRENDWTIFGFADIQEREMFNLLMSVNGVGPKLALSIVGTLTPSDIVDAILSDDHKLISQAPGVGLKLAQRLILELKSKIEDWQNKKGPMIPSATVTRNAAFDEVRSILLGLGYTPTEVNLALKKIDENQLGEDVEFLVKHCLKVLGANVS